MEKKNKGRKGDREKQKQRRQVGEEKRARRKLGTLVAGNMKVLDLV